MRLLAVSAPVDTEIGGKKPPTIKDEGIDLELTNWRALVAPPGISDAERARIAAWVKKVAATPAWKKNVERYDWTPFVKTGDELDDFVASEQKRVQTVVDGARDRQAVTGARVFGGVLLAIGAIALVASLGVGDGWSASGPRLAPAVASIALMVLSWPSCLAGR